MKTETDPRGTLPVPAAPTTVVLTPASDVVRTISPSLDVTTLAGHVDTPTALLGHRGLGIILPVRNVSEYLEKRKPQPTIDGEEALFITLPTAVREEVEALLTAFAEVKALVKGGSKVLPACRAMLKVFAQNDWRWHIKTFYANYAVWIETSDWVSAVNRAKAGPAWQAVKDRLPDDFVIFCASIFAGRRREDGKRQAIFEIKRRWLTGRDDNGDPAPVPGYGDIPIKLGELTLRGGYWQDWFSSVGYKQLRMPRRPLPEEAPFPPGWSYSNILDQIKKRNAFNKAVQALSHHSTSAAMPALPCVHSTRSLLRFLERVQFDDVKTDWRVIDLKTGEPCDLWLLIARDVSTTMLLGFGLRPARVREDGTQEHLKLADMKQLLGWLLERYGLPPYLVNWVFERGTATVGKAVAAAINDLLGHGRIQCHWTEMDGDKSPVGYPERKTGNSRGKAMLESHNRLMHTIGANLPGQTGPSYTFRPSDLAAREKEAIAIWKLAQFLPENLRGQVQYPLLTIEQARVQLRRIFNLQNERTEHECEGFETILEWFDPATGRWCHQSTAPDVLPAGAKFRERQESPLERAARLVSLVKDRWSSISPEVVAAFYDHSQYQVTVNERGQITFDHQGRSFIFNPPAPESALPAGTTLLAYFHLDDPKYLHLTDGRGSFVGTWLREGFVHDQDTLSQAIRYKMAALKSARATAETLAGAERDQLEAMRAHNAELLQASTFVEVSTPVQQSGKPSVRSGVAAGLNAVATERAKSKKAERDFAADAANAKKRLMERMI
jgi:hypothetical protein